MHLRTFTFHIVILFVIFGHTSTVASNFDKIVRNLENVTWKTSISNKCMQKKTNISLKNSNKTSRIVSRIKNKDDGKNKHLDVPDLPAVINLLNYISGKYIQNCMTLILYDEFYEKQTSFLKILFTTYPLSLSQGKSGNYSSLTGKSDKMCKQFLLFLKDPTQANSVIGDQNVNRIILVTEVSRWKVTEFLSSPFSHRLVNLLVIRTQNIMDKVMFIELMYSVH